MQITLVQTEIEEALTNYVMSQINIKEGMKVCIDLAATRGADGFKAIIDIVPANKVIAPKQAVLIAASPVDTPPPFDVVAPVAVPVVLPVVAQQPIQQEEAKGAPVEVFNPVAEALAIVTTPVIEEPVATPPTVAAEPTPPTVRSLFAGLKRPTNP